MKEKLFALFKNKLFIIGVATILVIGIVLGCAFLGNTESPEPDHTDEIVDITPEPENGGDEPDVTPDVTPDVNDKQEVNSDETQKNEDEPENKPEVKPNNTQKPEATKKPVETTKPEATQKPQPTEKPSAHTHSYSVSETVAAKCFEDGYKVLTCACGDSYRETIAKYDSHSTKQTNYVAPTYTEQGYTELTCTRCGHVMRNWIDKLVDTSNTPEATPEPTPAPTPAPEKPAEQKYCVTCGKSGHDAWSCTTGLTNKCTKCGVDYSRHFMMAVDWVCDCGASVGAFQCHSH